MSAPTLDASTRALVAAVTAVKNRVIDDLANTIARLPPPLQTIIWKAVIRDAFMRVNEQDHTHYPGGPYDEARCRSLFGCSASEAESFANNQRKPA